MQAPLFLKELYIRAKVFLFGTLQKKRILPLLQGKGCPILVDI